MLSGTLYINTAPIADLFPEKCGVTSRIRRSATTTWKLKPNPNYILTILLRYHFGIFTTWQYRDGLARLLQSMIALRMSRGRFYRWDVAKITLNVFLVRELISLALRGLAFCPHENVARSVGSPMSARLSNVYHSVRHRHRYD